MSEWITGARADRVSRASTERETEREQNAMVKEIKNSTYTHTS